MLVFTSTQEVLREADSRRPEDRARSNHRTAADMTTAPPPPQPRPRAALVGAAVRAAFGVTLGAGVLAVVVGALTGGSSAAAAAALGTGLVCVVFGLSALVVGAVASVSPAASLPVALLTYALQVLLMGVVLLALKRTGTLGSAVDARWLSGTLIAGTLVWTAAQVRAHVRAREPLYDLARTRPQAGAR